MADEVRSIIGKLIDKTHLFILSLGVVGLAAIAFEKTPIGANKLSTSPIGTKLIIPISITFIVIGLWQAIKFSEAMHTQKNKSNQNEKNKEFNQQYQLTLTIQNYKEQIKYYRQIIQKIQEVTYQKGSCNCNQLNQILDEHIFSNQNYEENLVDNSLIIKWIEIRIETWIKEIKQKDYEIISKQGKIKTFQDDIRDHLKLLCNNLEYRTYEAPHRCKTQRNFKDPFSYKKALKEIRKKIFSELENCDDPDLNTHQQDELIKVLSRLINDIQ